MVFGEIIEPSTRALCDDEIVEYPENEESELIWNGTVPTHTPNKLLIIDTSPILSIFKKCILGNAKPICELNPAMLKVYELQNIRVVTCENSKIIAGNITEKIIPWLTATPEVIVITSGSLLQNSTENAPCLIRSLTYNMESVCPKLEVPNLVTGFAASIFSYCIHIRRKCNLLVAFFDEVPLDSINTRPLLTLLNTLGLSILRSYEFQEVLSYNNLYI